MKRIFVIQTLLLIICFKSVFAQKEVSGNVYDANDKTPIPFVNVVVVGGPQGASTDTNGYFSFTCSEKYDSIRVSSLGYTTQKFAVGQNLKIFLKTHSTELGTFEVNAGENPAYAIMDNVVANKSKNRMSSTSLSFNEYQKIRFDLNNFTDKIKSNVLFKPFDYLWENEGIDTNGVRYLPAYIVEKYIRHYIKDEATQKSVVEAEKSAGMAGPNLLDFVDDMYITADIYDNFIPIFEKNFPSPAHDSYKLYHKYYLMDSVYIKNRKTYLITFKPKFVSQRAFIGMMKVDSASGAIVKYSMKFNIEANINFVRSYLIQQSFDLVDGKYWLVDTSSILGDFTLAEGSSTLTGFYGRKTSVFLDYDLTPTFEDDQFSGPLENEVEDSATIRPDSYWEKKRPVTLDSTDQNIFNVIDRLENDPKFLFRKNLFKSIATGNIPVGPFEIGDVYTFYNYNQVEFGRFKLSAKIKEKHYRPYEFQAFGAYGLRDNRWKYGFSGYYRFKFKKHQNIWLGGGYKNDIEQITRSYNLIPIDHIFSALSQYPDDFSRTYVKRAEGFFAYQPTVGINFKLDYEHEIFETIDLNAINPIRHKYINSSVGLTAKLSWLNTDLKPHYDDMKDINKRISSIPDLYIHGRYGSKILGAETDYWQLKFTLQQFLTIGSIGYLHYRITGAKTWGAVPYPFLDLPYGNESFINDRLAFNMMNFMEFATDEYISFHIAHHFDGWIFDKIPGVNKLKLRMLVYAKGLFGRMKNHSEYLYDLPVETALLQKPYYEFGLGFENILKFFRVDFVWRYTETPSFQKHYWFFIKPSVQFNF